MLTCNKIPAIIIFESWVLVAKTALALGAKNVVTGIENPGGPPLPHALWYGGTLNKNKKLTNILNKKYFKFQCIPGDNFESIHFFICFETAIPEQYMKLELVPKTFQDHPLQH